MVGCNLSGTISIYSGEKIRSGRGEVVVTERVNGDLSAG